MPTNSALESLIEMHKNIQSAWEELSDALPEQTEDLRQMLKDAPAAAESAKRELREMGSGTHEFGGLSFKVTPGPEKTLFDSEDVVMEAEDSDHIEALLAAGFLTYAVDSKQLNRLPSNLKAVYQEMGVTKRGTARVALPKALCK